MEGQESIHIELHPTLAKRTIQGASRQEVSYSPGISVEKIVAILLPGIDPDQLLLAVAGQVVKKGHVLQPGDTLKVILPIAGG